MTQLAGRTALVTGGSRGIGAAIVRRLAEEGADVALTYHRSPERAAETVRAVEQTGRRALAIPADAADPDAVVAAVDRAADALGRLDVLVNNAGIAPYGPLAEVRRADVDAVLAVHVRAVFLASQAAARHLGPGGRIISIGSSFAERVPIPGWTLYAASKSALTGLTRGLARDLGPQGVSVTVVHPGDTDTEMNPADSPDADAARALSALGRYGRPEDVAATVAHLAGPGGAQITGAAVAVDGGFAA